MYSRVAVLLSSIIISLFSHSLLAEYFEIKDKNDEIILSFYTYDVSNFSREDNDNRTLIQYEINGMTCIILIVKVKPLEAGEEDIVTKHYKSLLKALDDEWRYGTTGKFDYFKYGLAHPQITGKRSLANYYFASYKDWRIACLFASSDVKANQIGPIRIFEGSLTFGGPAPNTSEKQDTE